MIPRKKYHCKMREYQNRKTRIEVITKKRWTVFDDMLKRGLNIDDILKAISKTIKQYYKKIEEERVRH